MRLYLDDDSVAALLVVLLQRAGHDVQIPADIGLAGADDPVHLAHAALNDRVLLSHNYGDFKLLHDWSWLSMGIIRESCLCAKTTIRKKTSPRTASSEPSRN